MGHRPKHIFEYLLVRAFGLPFRYLPYRAALGIGWVAAWIGFHLVKFRREESCARIKEVFGDRYNDAEIKRIAWTSFRNQAFNVVEGERLQSVNMAWLDRHVDRAEALKSVRAQLDTESGAIVASPHMGNWDLSGTIGRLEGFPLFFLSRRQSNPLVTEYLFKQRMTAGTEVLDRDDPGMLKKTIRLLRNNQWLAMTVDVRNRVPGKVYQYIGKPAQLVEGAAVFAKMANVPIIPFIVVREGWGRHKWYCLDVIRPDKALSKKEDVPRMMQNVLDQFSEYALRYPEQFYWINKRWVLELHEKTKQELDQSGE